MTAIKIKKFYKKTGRRPRVDGKMHVAFDKRKVECFNCHNTGHFARECKLKRTDTDEEINHALMAIHCGLNNELVGLWDELKVMIRFGICIKSNAEVLGYEKRRVEYGNHGLNLIPSPTESNASSIVFSICPSNDSDGSLELTVTIMRRRWQGKLLLREEGWLILMIGNATPPGNNTNRINKANQFTPSPVNVRPNLSIASSTIKTVWLLLDLILARTRAMTGIRAILKIIQELSNSGICYFWWKEWEYQWSVDNDVKTVRLKTPCGFFTRDQQLVLKQCYNEESLLLGGHLSTPISKSADDILVFRKSLMQFAQNEDEVFLMTNEDEMPEIRILDNIKVKVFLQQASYDDDGVIMISNNLLMSSKLQQLVLVFDLPTGAKVHSTKWCLQKQDGREWSSCQRKQSTARALGHRQEEGIDYDEVLHCSKIEVIRLFLALSSFMGFIVYQMDVKSAFLYGTIDEEVYVSQPPGFVDPDHPTKVYKVVKALYGLHQAPRAWYATLSTFLEKHGYKRGTIDKTLFIRRNKKDIMLVQVYVDDIIFGSTNKSWCAEFEALMQSRFQMSSMGELTFFLGLQVKQNNEGIFISQDKYVADMLKKFDLVNVKAAITPMETKLPLTKDEEAFDVDVHLYRSMIGSLMYLTASRPDIMYAVCVCSRFQVTPKTSHLNAVKRIFKYLKGKPNLGLWYPRESPLDLEAFSDSDYGGSNLDRKSTTGGCQFLGQRLISWQCKKQTIVATSTTEAEYVAAANCCGQVLWVQNQLLDYGFNFMNTKIHIDNESTICIVKNPVYHSKTKHIEIRHHFIRDCYEKKLISVEKIHTDLNVADLLTKPFDGPRFNYLVVSIGMINP
ncbi:putative ribonuclease H-like domain-containing protein [Tanacetum coccineum]